MTETKSIAFCTIRLYFVINYFLLKIKLTVFYWTKTEIRMILSQERNYI